MSDTPLSPHAEFGIIVDATVDEAFTRWGAGESFDDIVRREPFRGIMDLILSHSIHPEDILDLPPELSEKVVQSDKDWQAQLERMSEEEKLALAAGTLRQLVESRADDGNGYINSQKG